jgi:RNA polymerase sigma factor (sigma-70 family)
MKQGISESEFIGLFKMYHQPVKHFIYYRTGDMDLADDVVQDAFLKFWEKKNEVRMSTAKTLLYTIAGNLAKNKQEHQKVVFQFANRFLQNPFINSPEFELELKEFDYKLQKAIAGLHEKNREVFLMNRIDGLTYKEIAENVGVTVKAVEKRMKKALDYLTERIEFKI